MGKTTKLLLGLGTVGLIAPIAFPTFAEEAVSGDGGSTRHPASESQQDATPEIFHSEVIPRLQELEPSTSTVEEWLAQSAIQITGIQLNPIGDGLEIVLETTGELSPVTTSIVGNALIADIPNVVLALPDGESF